MPEIKFCGLTRPEDVAHAITLDADYVGVVLAPSPRRVVLDDAVRLLESSAGTARRVGVFVSPSVDALQEAVRRLGLHAVQVHGDLPLTVGELRGVLGVHVWRVAAVEGSTMARVVGPEAADVLLFDTSVGGRTGGTGQPFDWRAARSGIEAFRGRARLAIAGGLTPSNVADAIGALSPDIVDVSSGIEITPGIKDHGLMSAFAAAVRATRSA
ncbi:MAG: phosphoribosylanthranilate isomerase [Gemmatimonadaceae bacterium]|nr:phosphoribosylanthranilate isomerase [Gemmatimonadaceae bacterium]